MTRVCGGLLPSVCAAPSLESCRGRGDSAALRVRISPTLPAGRRRPYAFRGRRSGLRGRYLVGPRAVIGWNVGPPGLSFPRARGGPGAGPGSDHAGRSPGATRPLLLGP